MKITDGTRTLNVTEKAYRVVYAARGFVPDEGGSTHAKRKTKSSNKRRPAAEKEPQEEGAEVQEEVGESDGN